MKQYYVIGADGQQQGPFAEAYIRRQYQAGIYTPITSVWCEGMPKWMPLATVFAAWPFSEPTPYDGPKEAQISNPFRAMAYAISHMFRYSGRARRKEYWMATLGFAIVMMVLAILLYIATGSVEETPPPTPPDMDLVITPDMSSTEMRESLSQAYNEYFRQVEAHQEVPETVRCLIWLDAAFLIFFGIVNLSMTCRRLHDIGRWGWLQLIYFVPYLGGVVILALCCFDSQPGLNKYGPNPKGK